MQSRRIRVGRRELAVPPPVHDLRAGRSPVRDILNSSFPNVLKIEPRNLLFLLTLIDASEVPSVNLHEKFGVRSLAPQNNQRPYGNQGIPYLLGSGASCTVVQHETGDEAKQIVPPGTLVALKIYRRVRRFQDIMPDESKALVNSIWHDLRILRHPYLRNHENFCTLLFFAWEPFNIVPHLALELAAFGTLSDSIESEFELSELQRCNISMDIVVGLHALHSCGFIHGDVKPSNIMLQKHPERQIIAKILDFSGSTDTARFGTLKHRRFFTKLWSAPEVLFQSHQYNNKEAGDVYSLGLVLTQMWPKEELREVELESFLEYGVPKYFSIAEKEDMILYYKCCPQSDEASTIKQALRWTTSHSTPLGDEGVINIHDILKSSLSPDPDQRKTMSLLLENFLQFAATSQRKLPAGINQSAALEKEERLWGDISQFSACTFSDTFKERSDTQKKLLFDYMVHSAPPPNVQDTSLIVGKNSDYEEYDALVKLLYRNMEVVYHPSRDQYEGVLHLEIAFCYLLGKGTVINEAKGLEYLASAAMGMVRKAMFSISAIEESCQSTKPCNSLDLPHRLFLALGYVYDATECGDLLAIRHPHTFELVRRFKSRRCGDPFNLEHAIALSDPSDTHFIKAIARRQSSSTTPTIMLQEALFASIAGGKIQFVEECLGRGADPNARSTERGGLTPLHSICLAPDPEAVLMAKLLLHAGADMSSAADEVSNKYANTVYQARFTPIHWAISKNRPLVFMALLDWCLEHSFDLMDGGIPILDHLIAHRQPRMLKRYIEFLQARRELNKLLTISKASNLLHMCIEESNLYTMGHRWMHLSNFHKYRQDLTEILLEMGADPLDGSRFNPLKHVIICGDSVCLKPMLESLKSRDEDIEALMSRDGIFYDLEGIAAQSHWSTLLASTIASCMDVFHHLINEYPKLIDQPSNVGMTPLFRVSDIGNLDAVKTLLQRGASRNILMEHPNEKHRSSILAIALISGNYEVAAVLVEEQPINDMLFPSPHESVFAMLLDAYCGGRRRIEIQAFQFIHDLGGKRYIINESDNAFRAVLRRGRPFLDDDVSSDLKLLCFFLRNDVFGDKINERDWSGRAPLHYAAGYGYIEAVELFLDHGAEVNLVTSEVANREGYEGLQGLTAIDITLNVKRGGASETILAGGASEIQAWQARIKDMIDLLSERGGTGSPDKGWNSLEIELLRNPSVREGFKLIRWSELTRSVSSFELNINTLR
jgi:serine/threonine protein kinase/ankyrin repeat protein